MSATSRWLPFVRWVPWGALYLAAGMLAAAAVGRPALVCERSGLMPTLRGEAYNPFARRALAPTLVLAIQATFPPSFREAIERRMRPFAGRLARHGDDISPEKETLRWRMMEGNWSYAIAYSLLNALCFAGFLFVLRALLVLFFHPPAPLAGAYPLLALLAVPIFQGYSTFFYDYPQLLLFTLGLYLIAARRERAFLLLLPFAMLSKETSLLLPVIYAVTRAGSMAPRRLALNVGLQLGICVAVLGVTAYVCRHHLGDVAENHFHDNLAEILQPSSFFRFRRLELCPLFPRGLDVPVPMGWNLPGMLVLGLIIAPGWREAPSFLKRTLPTMFVPLLGLMLVWGIWSELRAIRELLPIVLLLLYAGMRRLWRPRVPSA